uniref:Claudin n=1 Tax=Cynoglossus semilaevis TaxID=244447 RepID=A0A3P8WTM3_CYNSE
MVSFGLEVVGCTLSVLGWLLSVVSCALPMWRVSAFIGANIVTAQVYWEGLWMSCVFQSTGQMQCKVYDSMLALPQDLQAARALTIVSIILGVVALLISLVGAKCTNCIEDEGFYSPIIPAAQKMEIVGAKCTNCIEDEADFYNPLVLSSQRRELGAALYIGWGACALLLIGGAMLCSSCPPKEKKYKPPRMAYSAPRSTSAGYDRKDYV